MREDSPHQQGQQQDGENTELKLCRAAHRWLAELRLGQAGEVYELCTDQGDTSSQAKPLEARQTALLHHTIKLEQADDIEQHDDAANEKHRECVAGQQAVKDDPQ